MIRVASFQKLFLVTFLTSAFLGSVLGGLICLINRDLGIYCGIFIAGMIFSHMLDRVKFNITPPGG